MASPRPTAVIDWNAIRTRVASLAAADNTTDDTATLRQRATEMARPFVAAASTATDHPVIVFGLAGQFFALEAASVLETLSPRELTRLPGLPPTVGGLVNIRSRIVPAFDVRPLLQLPPAAKDSEYLLLVIADGVEFALLADEIAGARSIPMSTLRRDVPALNERLLRGIFPDGTALLDVTAIAAALTVEDARPRELSPRSNSP